jgi:hypothetical protein
VGAIVVEAWYDSLAVWRISREGKQSPDTDGFLGGRYRGLLTSEGRYRAIKTPFVPDEVMEVADLATAMEDFLPRLPAVPLAVGAKWKDSTRTIERLADRRESGAVFGRYRWHLKHRRGDRYQATDSVAVTLDQIVNESGELVWSETHGVVSWTRKISIAARIPATGGVKRSVRSIVDQNVSVVRQFDLPGTCKR